MRILELYSGIGGMHWALKESGLKGEIVAAIDINPACNYVYKYNFPNVNLIPKCLTSVRAKNLDDLEIDAVFMSPPCQPFTSLGNQLDVSDPRNKSFQHFMLLLNTLKKLPKYILLENVKGFIESRMRKDFLETLSKLSYNVQEYLLCPTQFGIPNSRKRYYLLAKLKPLTFEHYSSQIITEVKQAPKHTNYKKDGCCWQVLSHKNVENSEIKIGNQDGELIKNEKDVRELQPLRNYLQLDESSSHMEQFKVPQKLFKKLWLMDLVNVNSKSCCCFTKGYSKHIERSGSIFQSHPFTVDLLLYKGDEDNEIYLREVERLGLRFFTPKEVSNIMNFPPEFKFPSDLKSIQLYKLLGNSVNVHVISYLIQILLNEK